MSKKTIDPLELLSPADAAVIRAVLQNRATRRDVVAVRLGTSLLTLLVVSIAIFSITELLPGDVAEVVLGQSATPEAVAGLRAALHLDQPAVGGTRRQDERIETHRLRSVVMQQVCPAFSTRSASVVMGFNWGRG